MTEELRNSVAREVQRRIFPRAAHLVAVTYTDQAQPQSCVAVDFGVQGACLLLDTPFPAPEGEDLDMTFALDKDWTVPCKVRKVWEREEVGKFLVGVTYKTERSSDKNLIGPYVHKMKKS